MKRLARLAAVGIAMMWWRHSRRNVRSTASRWALCSVLSALSPLAVPSAQTTWFVDAAAVSGGTGTADDPFATIQEALARDSTVDGDTVLVLPGTYPELVDFLGKDVVLASTGGPQVTTIDATELPSLEQSVVKLRNGEGERCTLEGFTLRGGAGSQIVGPVGGKTVFVGGAIFMVGSAATIRDCIIVENLCDAGGGIYAEHSRPTIEGCTIEDNWSFYFGAGVFLNESDATLIGVTIRSNHSENQSGGIHAFGGNLVLRNTILDGNSGFATGGNIALQRRARATMSDVTVRGGSTLDGDGAGLWAEASEVEIERCTFAENDAGDPSSNRQGGAIYLSNATMTIDDSLFTGNTSARGGAIALSGSTASIRSTRFAGNSIDSGMNFFHSAGGALAASDSSATLTGCVFEENVAMSRSFTAFGPIAQGGAVWCDAPGLVIRDCLFQGNHAYYNGEPDDTLTKPEPGIQGGAVFGPALILRTHFVGNRATSNPIVLIGRAEGGAVFGGKVRECTFVANEVRGVGPIKDRGPAIEAATLACCKFEGNLPATLPAIGPNAVVLRCTRVDDLGRADPATK